MDDQRAEPSLSDTEDDRSLDDSVDGWIARARQAHDLIDSVDLDGVAEHEPQAVARMHRAAGELSELAAGAGPDTLSTAASGGTARTIAVADDGAAAAERERDDAVIADDGAGVAGADPEPGEPTPADLRSAAALEALELDGLSNRLGRLLLSGPDDPELALEGIPHRQGLPAFDFCLAPDRLPAPGCYGLFVNARCVFAALLPEPVAENRWRLVHTRPYDDDAGLIGAVRSLLET